MHVRLMEFLADPHDAGPLKLHTFEGDDHQTRDGILLNEQTGRWYVIEDGIPSLFVDGLRPDDSTFVRRYRDRLKDAGCEVRAEGSEKEKDFDRIESERQARDDQAEDYDRMLSLKVLGWFETPTYRKALVTGGAAQWLDSPLLEAGCGTGRLTGLFAEIAPEVVAVDMSRDSIARNRVRHLGRTRNPVHWVHADLTHMPLKDGVFGRCAHAGVYEHIPSRELRLRFLEHAKRTMKEDGVLMLSAYRYGGLTKRFGKEGEHAGGIPFFRFTPDELQGEVGTYFKIDGFLENLAIYMSMVVGRA